MPGPGAKFLWNAADERAWAALYARWLAQWDEGRDFMFADFVGIDPEVVMNRRAEIWLEDADELGFLMLSLGKSSIALESSSRHFADSEPSKCDREEYVTGDG